MALQANAIFFGGLFGLALLATVVVPLGAKAVELTATVKRIKPSIVGIGT